MKPAQLAAVIVLLVPAALHADLSDRQATEEMERRASLVCADYSVARGNPGIAAVSVDAVRVLLEHRYTLCPDRRISGEAAVIWYPDWGSLVWNPERPDSLHMLDIEARQLGRTLDFPQQITVWNAKVDRADSPACTRVPLALHGRDLLEMLLITMASRSGPKHPGALVYRWFSSHLLTKSEFPPWYPTV